MLRHGCYKKMFRKGWNFKVIALSSIRVVDWSVECPWKQWNLNLKEMQKVAIDIIYEDIRQIPKNILKSLQPLKCNETLVQSRFSESKALRLSQISCKKAELSDSLEESKLSDYCSNLEFTGLAVPA